MDHTSPPNGRHYELARLLANELFGTVEPNGRDGTYYDWLATVRVPQCNLIQSQGILLPSYLILIQRIGWSAKKDRLEITGTCDDTFGAPYLGKFAWPKIGLDGARDDNALVKSVLSRLCNKPEFHQELMNHAAARVAHGEAAKAMDLHVADYLKLGRAGYQMSSRQSGSTEYFNVVSNGTDVYWSGNVHSDGSFTFDRFGSMPKDKALRIIAIMNEGKTDDLR